MAKTKVILTPAQREFQKVKRFVMKRFPGAHTIQKPDGSYVVIDGLGMAVRNDDLLLPPARSVVDAWNQAKYCHWFTNMIRKSNNAFNEEKFYKKLAKEAGEE